MPLGTVILAAEMTSAAAEGVLLPAERANTGAWIATPAASGTHAAKGGVFPAGPVTAATAHPSAAGTIRMLRL